eukprot:6482563-Lingulodinium_polyedra.AAC.1
MMWSNPRCDAPSLRVPRALVHHARATFVASARGVCECVTFAAIECRDARCSAPLCSFSSNLAQWCVQACVATFQRCALRARARACTPSARRARNAQR